MKNASPDLDLAALIAAVQRNCDIADARHAGELTMCIFLLRMRDFYFWEHELPPGREAARAEIGEWMARRERLWDDLSDAHFARLPLGGESVDPFETDTVNAAIAGRGLVYSAGYGRRGRPHFFLGELAHTETRAIEAAGGDAPARCDVHVAGCEYARDVEAPPGMLLGGTLVVRTETLRRWLWDRVEEWRWSRKNEAMRRAMECYGFDADPDGALEAMTRVETESVILHELGEAMVGRRLGEAWPAMIAEIAGTRAEIAARALRDVCADCASTLPALIDRGDAAPIHFHFANFTGMRRELEPALAEAYHRWTGDADGAALARTAADTLAQRQESARAVLDLHRARGRDAAEEIERLLRPAPR